MNAHTGTMETSTKRTAPAVSGCSPGARSRCASVLFPVTLFAEPNAVSSRPVRKLRRGEFVEIVAERGQFFMVRDRSGDIGFVGRRAVAIREPAGPISCELREAPKRTRSTRSHPDYAGFGERLAAILLDGLIVALLSVVPASVIGFIVLTATYPSDQLYATEQQAADAVGVGMGAAILVWCVIWWGYVWIGTALGGTWGKRLVGLRVVRISDRQPPGFGLALARTLLVWLISYPLGGLWIIWDGKKQALYDKGPGTVVVRV